MKISATFILLLVGVATVYSEIIPLFPDPQPLNFDGSRGVPTPPPPAQGGGEIVDRTTIDGFVVDTEPPVIIIITADNPTPVTDFAFDTSNTIIGGERDVILTAEQGNSGLVFTAGASGGTFSISTPNDGNGFVVLQYDGTDGSIDLDIENGLGGVDLTEGDAVGFRINALSDVPTEFTINLYDSNGNTVSSNSQVDGGSEIRSYELRFDEFNGQLDFTSITALEFEVEAFDNVDFNLITLVTYTDIVAPPPVVVGCVNDTVSPCQTKYYRLEELVDVQPGDYISVQYFPDGEISFPESTATFYMVHSNFEDLQNELALNTNIVSTLGELPGPTHYDYRCTEQCDIEVVWSALQNTTYYLAVEGHGPGITEFILCLSQNTVPITPLNDSVSFFGNNSQRATTPPDDNVLHYEFFSIDVPVESYAEGTYLVVNLTRVQPTGEYSMVLMHEGLPEFPGDTGVLNEIDFNSYGNRVDDAIYPFCVNTSVQDSEFGTRHPQNFQPRIPCQCDTFRERLSFGFFQTCQLTVDPCQFKYGTWYIGVLLPERVDPTNDLDESGRTNFTITASIKSPDIITLPRNATIRHSVGPRAASHYRINVPANEYFPCESHFRVHISNVVGGFVNVDIHQGQGVGENLAGPESCQPANATCRTCDSCNVVVEKCHFNSGPWYISVSVSRDENGDYEIFDSDRLPIGYTIQANWVEDAPPVRLVAGVPVSTYIGAALYDFYVLDVPPTIDTFLYVELFTKANDTEVAVAVLHGELPGGDCYARPDFYCLTGDPRGIRSSYGPTSFINNEAIQREGCYFMIQSCELTAGPLYFSVYGHDNGYIPYGDDTFYQVPVDYTLYVEFDTPLALTSGVSYSEVVYQDEYQHYYIRADSITEGQWLSMEVTNIQHGIPQTIEAYINHNFLAGDCPCYDSMFTCTQDSLCRADAYNSPFAFPDIESVNTCCTVLVHPSDFKDGVWYMSVRGINEDQFQYTTPIGYTITVTIYDPPQFNFLPLGEYFTGVAPQWNKTLEYVHFRLAAEAVPLSDLVIKLTWVQTCDDYEYRGHLQNMWEEMSLYVNYRATAGKNPTGHIYSCTAQDIDDSFCTVVIPHCEWIEGEYLLAVRADVNSDFPARFTLHAQSVEVRDVQLQDGVSYYDRVPQGLYKHYFIDEPAEEDQYLSIDVYTNQDQDPVTVYLAFDTRAGDAPCYTHTDSCVTQSCCSWHLNACDLAQGRAYISVRGAERQFYDLSTEFTVLAAHVPVRINLLDSYPVTGHLSASGEIAHYAYEVDDVLPGHVLEFSVDSVKHGSVTVYGEYETLAGRCPCFTWSQRCSADSAGKDWCSIRIPSCTLKTGTYYFSVWADNKASPDPPVFTTPIGFSAQVQVLVPTFGKIENDIGRQVEDTLFQSLASNRYRHYAISWDDDDFEEGYHLIVEITNVQNADLEVYYNTVDPADESCSAAQICSSGIGPGADCYWQLPYCLTKPLDDPLNHYISIYNNNPGARQLAQYNILIWKQPVPSVTENPRFTLDNVPSSASFPPNTELNVTHSVFNEPNGWTQFIKLPNVDLTIDRDANSEILELFFYRITNNIDQPMVFNVYAHPNEPAGAHECCREDPGSCQGAPCSHSADTTTLTNSKERITHTCVLDEGLGANAFNGNPFFGQQCVVRVWPCEFGKYCVDEDSRDWFVSVVPIAPTSVLSDGPGLSYSFQWRVRSLRILDSAGRSGGTVDLTDIINTHEYSDVFAVNSGARSLDDGWRSFALNFPQTLGNSSFPHGGRLSLQTDFVQGEGTVYVLRDGFAAGGPCFDYECSSPSNVDCAGAGRFIVSECCSNIPNIGYYITIRNTGDPTSLPLLVRFRATITALPEPIFIESHPSADNVTVFTSSPSVLYSNVFNGTDALVGVDNENYDFYELIIDDDDLDRDQSWVVFIEYLGNSTDTLNTFIRFGALPGVYGPSADQVAFGTEDEGCHGWEYFCTMNNGGSCFYQIPHCELLEGFHYIGIQNPVPNFSGVPEELPQYRLTTYISDPPTLLNLNEPLDVFRADFDETVFPIGGLLHYTVNLTAPEGGFDDRNDLESYWVRHLRFQVSNITNGFIDMFVNYDELAGPNQQGSCIGSHAERLCEPNFGCYYDAVPCEIEGDDFKLKTGIYYVALRLSEPSDFQILVQILTEEYQPILASNQTEQGVGSRAGTDNVIYNISEEGDLTDGGDGDGNYRYVIDFENGDTDDDDMVDNQYLIFNISSPGLGVNANETLHMDVWRDDCTRFSCDLDGPFSWCTIDALTLGPCALKGGRYYIRVENPVGVPFDITAYLNETIIVPIQDRQVITEIISPYEYQEYFYEAHDVGDGATLTAKICSICGEVEAWIRPDFPAGPTPDVTGEAESCSVDHCETVSGPERTAFSEFPQNCCYMFLDTCEYEQRGYYVGIRGVTRALPSQRNPFIYLPATYNIEIYQTTVNITDLSYAQCPKTINYYEPVDNVPRQYAIDLETLNVGSTVRVSLRVTNGPDTDASYNSRIAVNVNSSLGYSDQCPQQDMELQCKTNTTCDIIVPYCYLSPHGASRLYIQADAPRGSEILVERYDPIVPVIYTDVAYDVTMNGPTTGEDWDLPYRPNVQIYRFDVHPTEEDDRFFARVVVNNVQRGTVSAVVNSGQYPWVSDTGCPSPVFVDDSSCSSVSDGESCHIDIQYFDLSPDSEFLRRPRTFWLTFYGLDQTCERNSIAYSFVVQTNFVVTYFPAATCVCDVVAPEDYNFHRLPRSVERPQESILRFTVSDISEDESATLLINEGRLATADGSDTVVHGPVGSGFVHEYFCGYEELYFSVLGGTSNDGEIDYNLCVQKESVPVKELFDDSVYHADDDDDDACPHEHDFYIFPITLSTQSPAGTFFRVAVDSEFPTEVYVNRGSIAWRNCHNAAAGSNNPRETGTTTVNVYDFCDYADENYYVTVVSDGPYYIYTDIRDDPKNLTLGEVFRDELEPGMYQMYTLEVCDEWFEADERLVVEITDVEHGDVYGWIRLDRNPGLFNHDDESGDCSIDTAFADYGANESGYDFLLVNSCELQGGVYHILIRASPHEGAPERNCQHVEYRLYPYLIDYQIDPDIILPNSVVHDVVDFYTINRIDERAVEFINYYTLTPFQGEEGYIEQISQMVVRLANVDGGLLRLRVMCGHLAVAEFGYFDGEIYGLTKEDLINPRNKIQSGRRPFSYQRMLDSRTSRYQPECDGCTDFCCEMTFDDIEEYQTDKSCAVWIPSCYLVFADLYLAVEPVHQFSEDHSIRYDLAVTQSHDFIRLVPNTQFVSSFSSDNWDYDFLFSVTNVAESMRWRVVVTEGEGVLVTVRNHRCPLQATWSKEIWCDAAYFDRPWMCDIEIPTLAEHPQRNAFFLSIFGKNATYSLGNWVGRENCHDFVGSGRSDGLDFCAGLVPYAVWRWDSYLNLDNEAKCFFEELYAHFQVQPCYTGVTSACNSTLQAFACYESFHRCDEQGFAVPTCRQACDFVVQECANTFDLVDLEHYNCTSPRYGDPYSRTCTISDDLLATLPPPGVTGEALAFKPSPNIVSDDDSDEVESSGAPAFQFPFF